MNWSILKKIKDKKSYSIIIFLVIFCVTLGYSFYHRIEPVVDAKAYDKIAVNLVNGFGFREDRTQNYQFDTAIIRAGPGYEFFLATIYNVFGYHYEAVWIIQAILHVLSALLLFFISRKLFVEKGEQIGLIAAGLFGFHPDLIEISAMLMTETLYLFFIILVAWFLVDSYQALRRTFWHSIVFGLVTGFAILTRPTVILFIVVIGAFCLYQKKYRILFLFGLGLVATLTPWVIHNYLIFHQFILTTLIGSCNLWVGNTLLANGGQIAGGFNPLTTYTAVHGFFNLKEQANQEFLTFVFTYPFVFLKLVALRFIRYFSLIRPMGFWFYQTGFSQALFVASSAFAQALLFVCGFSGMLVAWRTRQLLWRYLVILALMAPIPLIATVVESRYRFQIYPFLALFGGYAIVQWEQKLSWFKQRYFMIPFLFFVIVSIIDLFLFSDVVLEHLNRLF